MIYITGDTHGEVGSKKLNNSNIKEVVSKYGKDYPDYVIICGDFGFIWDNSPNNAPERYWLNWLDEKPWVTLFIDGNHENHVRLNKLPTVKMFGSEVGQVSDKVFHLRRGQVYTIEGKKFFILGGAESTDKGWRTPYVSWWPEEVPTYSDYRKSLDNLQEVEYKIDYVITHTFPKSVVIDNFDREERFNDPTGQMLEDIKMRIDPNYKWFGGHFHEDRVLNDDRFMVVYQKGYVIE